ncbi:MAG: ABC transporter ATP-binding protein [Deltaproteobacteria bacterium]|nr:ABC transporter ATP-binding protein [Deltaproteobacteria bacterium]
MNILETRDLCHHFKGMQVLFDVGLAVRKGEHHAIIGPNGAGKTTLFNVITGTYHPSGGQVLFKGQDITGLPPHKLARRGLGRSFQITSTFEKQTVFQNIRMGVMSRMGVRFDFWQRVAGLKEVTQETEEILEGIGLTAERNVPAGALSYGGQRALEVSMALSTNPDLVMLDEPTAGMSKEETHATVELIKRLTHGKSMVMVEHDMDVVFTLADRITVLYYGAILASGPPEEIRENEAVRDAYLGDMEFCHVL